MTTEQIKNTPTEKEAGAHFLQAPVQRSALPKAVWAAGGSVPHGFTATRHGVNQATVDCKAKGCRSWPGVSGWDLYVHLT